MATNEELVKEIKSNQNVTANLTRLYQQNAGLIRTLASRYKGVEDIQDLTQTAYFGLIRAVELWEPEQGVPFVKYAAYWMRAAMWRYISTCGAGVRIPDGQRARIYQYNRAVNSIRLRFGRDPVPREIMLLLEITREQYDQLMKDVQALRIRSTADPIGGDDGDGEKILEDILQDDRDPIGGVIDRIQNDELSRTLWEQVDQLPQREADYIRARFRDNLTMEQCGDLLGVSAAAARSIEAAAMRKLRRPKTLRILRPYLTESAAYSIGIKGGLQSFRRSGMSSTERGVMMLETYTGSIWKDET